MISKEEAGKIPYVVMDLETSVDNVGPDAVGTFKASPFAPKNKIVASGWMLSYWNVPTCIYTADFQRAGTVHWSNAFDKAKILVGHNIKFDMHYLAREESYWREWFRHNRVWDTMLAEYILSGQLKKYPSLDYCSEKYGGTLKDDKIKQYWDDGVRTENIPKGELIDYLYHDVANTELVFRSQLHRAQVNGMLPLIFSQMEGLMATFEMEHNGMYFNDEVAHSEMDGLKLALGFQQTTIATIMKGQGITDPNPSSNQQISAVIFGGEIEETKTVPMLDEHGIQVFYKSGKNKGSPRFKKEKSIKKIEGLMRPPNNPDMQNKDGKTYKVNDEVLKNILKAMPLKISGKIALLKNFVEAITKYRRSNKDISTYFQRSLDLQWDTGLIHPTINHCATGTGRLSQTNPNLQNQSGGDK